MWQFFHRVLKAVSKISPRRKRAEVELRQSEERFRLLVEGVTDYAIFMLDPRGVIETWNPGAERLKGYTAGEVIGKHFSIFYPPDALERGRPDEELRRAGSDGRVEDEGVRVRKDGSHFWANVVITALYDESGALRGYAKITKDLTARREAEARARSLVEDESARKTSERYVKAIERQREQLQVTLASIGDAVIVTDAMGIITYVNPVAVSLTGWTLREAEGKKLEEVFQIINDQTRLAVENPVSRIFRDDPGEALRTNTSTLVTKNGDELPIEGTAAAIRSPDGESYGAVLVFRDVTQSRRAVEARLRLAAIVESSDDAIISNSLEGLITSWNKGAERLYGYTSEEVIGKELNIIATPEHVLELGRMLDRVKAGEFIEHYQTERRRKDGTKVEVSLTISPIRNADGKVVGASKIARDVSARNEEARLKDEFLALLAHELRNPLAPIRNGLRILQLAGDDLATIAQASAVMERQLQHMVRLVDDLLDVSRISRRKLHLRKDRITLAAIVKHSLEVCGSLARERGHEITVTLPEEPVYVDADETRLVQVICNLLNNATKYTDVGGRIWVSASREGSEAVIRVKDSGIGIPAPMLDKVFDLFTQVDRSLEKSQGGLGVGLSIVKWLVELHGGTIKVLSEGQGMGSEFIVRLPVVSSLIPQAQTESNSARKATVGRRILVVDDNVDAANSLAMMLELMGNIVKTAYDGEAGVEAALSFTPDLILMDIGMPKLNGFDACRRIRENPGGKMITIVALTGWGQEEDKRRSKEAGFDGHLVKPVEPATIEDQLSQFVSQAAFVHSKAI